MSTAAYMREYQRAHRAQCNTYNREYYARNIEAQRERITEQRVELKRQVFNVLGNQCAHCGMNDVRVLQIDHKHNDGNTERRTKGPSRIMRSVLSDPSRYQLLCANCHQIKTCSHE